MRASLFAQTMAATAGRQELSPQQQEKDRAVEVARAVVSGHVTGLASEDLQILARQLLRALALS